MKETQRTARGFRQVGSLLLAMVAAVGLTSGTAFGATAAEHSAPPTRSHAPHDPMRAVAAMQPSWNMGNTLDAIPDETSWGNPLVTKALFDTLRANGFHSVRIPVTWSGHQVATAPYTIDPTFLSRVRQVIDWALSDGLYVEINVHHDSWQWIANMATDHDTVLARFDAIWRQVATEFRDEPARLLFESVNEPQFNNATDAQKTQFLNELNTSFDTIVRRSGGGNATRLLVLPTLGSTPSQSLMNDLATTMSSLHDHNLVATVHYYSFWPFSVNIAGFTRFDATVLQDMTDTFALMHDTFVAKGIPVFLGEYGLLGFDTGPGVVERGETLKYFEALGHQARVSGVTTALWDNGFFLDRTAMGWRDPGLFAQIRSGWSTRSGTASTDSVFVPKSSPITAGTLTLNLNGTTFRGLWQGRTRLVAGRDYTVSGSQLTLTAAALTRLTGARAYGTDATLLARFSKGVPWQLNVITYDTPVQSSATGTVSSFAVPTLFQGDRLATMEARYADGSNAGPANWTSFQQFGVTFSPDYTNNVVTLTPAFLNAVNDGAPVTLTFHFWSGATMTYQVTRSGSSVTGSTS
jgi:endoglucanase